MAERLDLKALVAALRHKGPSLLGDGAGLVGAVLIAIGCREIYAPAGWIVAGALLIGGAFLAARGRR